MTQSKDRENINTSLLQAIKKQDMEEIKRTITEGADVNTKYLGKTMLQIACQKDSVEIVSYLLLVGANPKTLNESGRTLIHISAFLGKLQFVKLFKENGVDLDIQDSLRATSLHYACSEGHLEVVQYLMEHGANPNIKNKNGKTPLELAIDHNQDHVIEYFIQLQNKSPRMSTLTICVVACIVIACYIDPLYMGVFCIAGIALAIARTSKLDNKTNIHLSTSIVDPKCCKVNSELNNHHLQGEGLNFNQSI